MSCWAEIKQIYNIYCTTILTNPSPKTKPCPKSQRFKFKKGESNLDLGLSLKYYGLQPYPPHNFRGSELEYMVQIKALRTPDCKEGVPSLSVGGHREKLFGVVHYNQEENYHRNL